jgi:cysteinyl-tRNA synthetase
MAPYNMTCSIKVWKFFSRDDLAREREEKRRAEEGKAARKAEVAAREKAAKEAKAKAALVRANEMFLGMTDKYSSWDENGIPTKDAEGKEISKSALKKITKEYEKQKDLNKEFGIV